MASSLHTATNLICEKASGLLSLANPTCLFAVLLAFSGQSAVEATTATAGSGFWAARNSTETDNATWRFSTPTSSDNIRWSSGPNNTDGVLHPLQNFGPEQKFNTPPGGGVTGRAFAGFGPDVDGPGPAGSTTQTTGGGSSTVVPGSIYGINHVANWTVTATGTLGGGASPFWSSRATGQDPFIITPAQLSDLGIIESSYDLFFAAALSGGDYSEQGRIGLNVFYDTASSSTNLLSIEIDSNGVSVTNENPSGLSFYLLGTLEEGPTEMSANLTTLSSIEAMLETDVASDRKIDAPLYLGLIWDNIPVPTVNLSDGSVASIRIESNVADAASVPEPSSALGLLALGTLGAGSVLKRKVTQHKSTEKPTEKAA